MPNHYDRSTIEGHFEHLDVVDFIDSGGFKDVFLAESENGPVVLKLLPIDRTSRRSRALREGDAMKKISFPNFVDLIECFEDEIAGTATYVIIEEYIDGETLSAHIRNGGYNVNFGLHITNIVLEFLIELDELDMIHRDIKPKNIMVGDDGEITILDVGIVRFEEEESLTPDDQDRLGTMSYGAPEQLDYDKGKQSIRTDLFSTGIVMFESITGQHPFRGHGKSVMEAILEGDTHKLSDYVQQWPTDGDADLFFETMVQREPGHRYRKPSFAKDDFDAIFGDYDV